MFEMTKSKQKQLLIELMQADEKDGLYPAKNIKNGNVNIKCDHCGGCGYHKMSCSTHSVNVFLNPDSRIAKRILRYTKSATPKVKRNKDLEP